MTSYSKFDKSKYDDDLHHADLSRGLPWPQEDHIHFIILIMLLGWPDITVSPLILTGYDDDVIMISGAFVKLKTWRHHDISPIGSCLGKYPVKRKCDADEDHQDICKRLYFIGRRTLRNIGRTNKIMMILTIWQDKNMMMMSSSYFAFGAQGWVGHHDIRARVILQNMMMLLRNVISTTS